MPTFNTVDDWFSAFPAKRTALRKDSITATANTKMDLWRASGAPGVGLKPSSIAGLNAGRATPGAMPLPTVSGGKRNHANSVLVNKTSSGTVEIIDRIWQNDGLSGTSLGQTINSPAFPARVGNGEGLKLAILIYTPVGATPVTLTIGYTNSNNDAGRQSVLSGFSSSFIANRFIEMPWDTSSGINDVGIRSIQATFASGSTGTAGEFGLIVYRSLFTAPVPVGSNSALYNFGETALFDIDDDACLSIVDLAQSTSTGIPNVEIGWLQKVPA